MFGSLRLLSLLTVAALSAAFSLPAQPASTGGLGVVLMHGKGGACVPSTPCGRLKDALESKGYLVAAPVMPRGRGRIYDKDYEASMQEIAGLVAELKAKGAERVVLAGHSLGGNAALGYAVSRVGIAGLISLATGHQLENHFLKQQGLGEAVAKAKAMIDAGKGDEIDAFADFNMKPQPPARTTARNY